MVIVTQINKLYLDKIDKNIMWISLAIEQYERQIITTTRFWVGEKMSYVQPKGPELFKIFYHIDEWGKLDIV